MKVPAKITCPHCGTKNEVNLAALHGHAVTCSRCEKTLFKDVENISIDANDIKSMIKETQSSILKNMAVTSSIIFAAIVLVILGVREVLNIPMRDEDLLVMLGALGIFFVFFLGVIWVIKKSFSIFK